MEEVDYIIVGAGYAGVFFAHQLIKENKSFKIFYDGHVSASHISAGVCNPVILKRFNTFWKSEEQVEYLNIIFNEIENYTGKNYLVRENVVRIFHNESEKLQWLKKSNNQDLRPYLNPEFVKLAAVENPNDSGLVDKSCRIDVMAFFDDLLAYLRKNGNLIDQAFDYYNMDNVNKQYENLKFEKIIFCEGVASKNNPFFREIPIQPNKGHCLKVKLQNNVDQWTIKKKHFLFSVTGKEYYYGGTYDRFDQTSGINEEAVDELKIGLEEIYKGSYEILDISTAFRATVGDRRPILGRHQEHAHLYIFNGLGARGVYNGSYFSKMLFDFIEKKHPLLPEVDVKRFFNDFI